jgi:hypothetical protein
MLTAMLYFKYHPIYIFSFSFPDIAFLDVFQTKVVRVFLLATVFTVTYFHFFKLTQPLTVFIVQSQYNVKEKGGKPDKKPCPLPYDLRNPYRNLKSENSDDHAQKPQRKCTFMNSASARLSFSSPFTLNLDFDKGPKTTYHQCCYRSNQFPNKYERLSSQEVFPTFVYCLNRIIQ